jgi:hypothetical protein
VRPGVADLVVARSDNVGTIELVGQVSGLAPLSRNQIEFSQIDGTAAKEPPGLRSLGLSPPAPEDELEAMFGRRR